MLALKNIWKCVKKCIVMTWQEQCFREPWAVDEKSSDESHQEVTTQEGKQRATCAEQRNPRNSAKDYAPKRDAWQASPSGPKTNRHILHSAWFSKHTTRLLVHTSACLKHSNFLNADRMRKRDGPTAVHMKPFSTSVFSNSDRDVSSSFRATQMLRQGPAHPTLWNTSVF